MARGDFDAAALLGMGMRAADPQQHADDRAKDALRVLPQLTATDLQHCIAFKLDPFTFLAAKLAEAETIAADRQRRIEREDGQARYSREMEERANTALDALRIATTADQEIRAQAMLRELSGR